MSCRVWLNVWSCLSFTCPLIRMNLDRNPTAAFISGFMVPRAQRVCIERLRALYDQCAFVSVCKMILVFRVFYFSDAYAEHLFVEAGKTRRVLRVPGRFSAATWVVLSEKTHRGGLHRPPSLSSSKVDRNESEQRLCNAPSATSSSSNNNEPITMLRRGDVCAEEWAHYVTTLEINRACEKGDGGRLLTLSSEPQHTEISVSCTTIDIQTYIIRARAVF